MNWQFLIASFSLSLVFSATSLAQSGAALRAKLAGVSATEIAADLQEVLTEQNQTGAQAKQELEYVFCAQKDLASVGCYRIIQFTISKINDDTATLVLSYQAIVGEKRQIQIEKNHALGSLSDLDQWNFPVFRAALNLLQKTYELGGPLRSQPAFHPFSVKILRLSENGERIGMDSETDHWEISHKHLIQFQESLYTRVVTAAWSYTYVLESMTKDDKVTIKSVKSVKF